MARLISFFTIVSFLFIGMSCSKSSSSMKGGTVGGSSNTGSDKIVESTTCNPAVLNPSDPEACNFITKWDVSLDYCLETSVICQSIGPQNTYIGNNNLITGIDENSYIGDVIILPLAKDGAYEFLVDWGDGSYNIVQSLYDDGDGENHYKVFNSDQNGNYLDELAGPLKNHVKHNYNNGIGEVTLTITGKYNRFETVSLVEDGPSPTMLSNSGYKLLEVVDWGKNEWGSFNNMFNYALNLYKLPSTPPNLSKVKSFQFTFYYAVNIDADLSLWDVSNASNMLFIFMGTENLSSHDLSSWDVSGVIDICSTAEFSSNFDQSSIFSEEHLPDFPGLLDSSICN